MLLLILKKLYNQLSFHEIIINFMAKYLIFKKIENCVYIP
jgi:hypothetical protein